MKFLNDWELQNDALYVGRAFENVHEMIYIWDVPQEEPGLISSHINTYQLPCVVLDKHEYNFFDAVKEDTVFSGDLEGDDKKYEEISFERFFDAISERMADFTCYLEQVRSAAVEATEV